MRQILLMIPICNNTYKDYHQELNTFPSKIKDEYIILKISRHLKYIRLRLLHNIQSYDSSVDVLQGFNHLIKAHKSLEIHISLNRYSRTQKYVPFTLNTTNNTSLSTLSISLQSLYSAIFISYLLKKAPTKLPDPQFIFKFI